MKYNIKAGLGLLIVGGILAGVNMYMISTGKYFPKMLVLGPTCGGLGLGFLFFPGAEPPAEMNNNEKSKYHFSKAPILSKIMWFVLGIGGLAGGFMWMMKLDGHM